MTAPETGMVPVPKATPEDIPADLGRPRSGPTVGEWVGIVTGGLLLLLTVGLFGYAILSPGIMVG